MVESQDHREEMWSLATYCKSSNFLLLLQTQLIRIRAATSLAPFCHFYPVSPVSSSSGLEAKPGGTAMALISEQFFFFFILTPLLMNDSITSSTALLALS